MREGHVPPAARCGDTVGTEPSQLARPRCPAPAGAVAPGAGGQRRVAADGGSWRRQSGGRDKGGIVRWRRWHSSARLGTARRRTPCQQRALPCAAGAERGRGAVPVSLWVRGAAAGWAGLGCPAACARLCSHRGCERGLGAAGTRVAWWHQPGRLDGMSGGRRRWELVSTVTTACLQLVSSPLGHLEPAVGPWGDPCGQDPALCQGGAEHLQQPWLETTPAAPRRAGSDATGRAGRVASAGAIGAIWPLQGGRKRRRAAGKAAAGRREITPPGALSHILPSGAFPAALPAPAPAPVAVGTEV